MTFPVTFHLFGLDVHPHALFYPDGKEQRLRELRGETERRTQATIGRRLAKEVQHV